MSKENPDNVVRQYMYEGWQIVYRNGEWIVFDQHKRETVKEFWSEKEAQKWAKKNKR